MNISVFVSGRGSNLKALMDAADSGYLKSRIALVLSNVADAAALVRSQRNKIPSRYIPQKSFEREALPALREASVDLVCLAGFMRILSGDFIRAASVPILNVHPSLLPAFPGLNAQKQALERGVRVSGATVHLVDEWVDHGPILAQAPVPVFEKDDEESLSERILREEHRIYPMAVRWFAEGRIRIEGDRVLMDDLPSETNRGNLAAD